MRVNRYARSIKEISEHEFWIFWGIILSARTYGRQGGSLWDKEEPEGEDIIVNLSKHMTLARHKDMKRYVAFLFADETLKETDPWWQITCGVQEFNNNQKQRIYASFKKVFDESMSALKPRTTKNGNLPHLSCIKRKPEPLGTEFKVVADSATGIFLHLELQRGKKEMKKPELLEFANQFGGTVACSKRLAKETVRNNNNNNNIKNLWMGDSWFGSVKTAVQVAEYGNFIGIVKTAHSFYPKQWLEEKMKGWPGGSHLVLEGTKDNIPLIAIGYKYNKKK